MEEAIRIPVTGRCAIVTGANKGIGFEICKQLAENGVMVVLTARDEKKGREAIEKIRAFGLSEEHVVFHQLEVTDSTSIASLIDFVKTSFGKLDILINNAGISGVLVEGDAQILHEVIEKNGYQALGLNKEEIKPKSNGSVIETYELAEQCIEINYCGAKKMIEAFIPLLQLSDSPRIVNVSSLFGVLKLVSNEWAIGILSDVESLTDEKVDEVWKVFLKDFKEDSLKAKNWPLEFSAYKLSKASLNAYTRIMAKRYSTFYMNCVSPGYVRTDMTINNGWLSVEEGADNLVRVALMPHGGPSGLYFHRQNITPF